MEGIDRCHAALVQMSFHGRAGGSTIVIEKCLEDGPVMFDGLVVPAVCELVVRRWHRPDKVTKKPAGSTGSNGVDDAMEVVVEG